MKKLLLIIPILLFSCKKDSAVSENIQNQNSEIQKTEKNDAEAKKIQDSIVNNSPITKEVLRTGVSREIEGNKIIRIADAAQLPFNIGEEFTNDDQEFILKIKNFAKDNISVSLTPKNSDMNVRINQIKLPDGNYDGPFGREISDYEVPEKGEVWLIIGKSNMASGETKGSFSVSVE